MLVGNSVCSGFRAEATKTSEAGIFQRATRELNVWIPFTFHRRWAAELCPRVLFPFQLWYWKTLHWEEYAHLPASRRVPRATLQGFVRQMARSLAQNYLRNLNTVTTNLSWVLTLKICSSYSGETSDKSRSPASPNSYNSWRYLLAIFLTFQHGNSLTLKFTIEKSWGIKWKCLLTVCWVTSPVLIMVK